MLRPVFEIMFVRFSLLYNFSLNFYLDSVRLGTLRHNLSRLDIEIKYKHTDSLHYLSLFFFLSPSISKTNQFSMKYLNQTKFLDSSLQITKLLDSCIGFATTKTQSLHSNSTISHQQPLKEQQKPNDLIQSGQTKSLT